MSLACLLTRYTALVALPLLLAGAADVPAERVVVVGQTVPVSVDGQVRRLRIDPGAPGIMLLTRDYAQVAALKPGKILGISLVYWVGGERILADTDVARVAIDGARPRKQRVGWTPRPYADGIDAVIGPAGLDEPVVRFVLRASVSGEREVAIPMHRGGWFGDWRGQQGEVTVGSQQILVRFDPHQLRSHANAIAAARLAAVMGGRLTGPAVAEQIGFGIDQPVRPMALARPLAIGPLTLSTLGARITPDRNDAEMAPLPEANGPEPVAADPDDVVVRGKREKKRPGTLTLGADQLSHCSAIAFDFPRKQIRLRCR